MAETTCEIGDLLFCVIQKEMWVIEACRVCCVEICEDKTTITVKSFYDGAQYKVFMGANAFADVRDAAKECKEKRLIEDAANKAVNESLKRIKEE